MLWANEEAEEGPILDNGMIEVADEQRGYHVVQVPLAVCGETDRRFYGYCASYSSPISANQMGYYDRTYGIYDPNRRPRSFG